MRFPLRALGEIKEGSCEADRQLVVEFSIMKSLVKMRVLLVLALVLVAVEANVRPIEEPFLPSGTSAT